MFVEIALENRAFVYRKSLEELF